MATVSSTQYDRCSGSTSLTTPATPMQAISRSVNIRLSLPPPNSSSSRPASPTAGQAPGPGGPGSEPFPARSVRCPGRPVAGQRPRRPGQASRSASMPGLSSQGGGIIGGGAPVPDRVAQPGHASMTSGGGRFPATPSATAASAIRWLAFSAPTRRARCRFRPLAVDRAVSSSS